MSRALPLALLLAAACVSPGLTPDGGAKQGYGVTLYTGRTYFDSDWGSFDEQRVGGVALDCGVRGEGLVWELGFQGSKEQAQVRTTAPDGSVVGVSFEGRTRELFGGARYEVTVLEGRVVPYVGGGASLSRGSLESFPAGVGAPDSIPIKVRNSETWLVPYLHAGVRFPVGWDIDVGLDYRYQFGADYDLGDNFQGSEFQAGRFDGDYHQLALTLGIGF